MSEIGFYDKAIAKEYSLEEGVFVNYIQWCCEKNEFNNRHFEDGYYWTYNSTKALERVFDCWSADQINRIIKKCVDHGLILVRKNNKKGMDRTRNFAISEFAKSIQRKYKMDFANPQNGFGESAKYNIDIINNNKTNNKHGEEFGYLDSKLREEALGFVAGDDELAAALDGFFQMRKQARKPVKTERALKLLFNRLSEYSGGNKRIMREMLDKSTENGWTSVYGAKQPMYGTQQKQRAGDEF